MELSSFTNGDKKAVVERKDYNYTVNYYINNKIVSKDVVGKFEDAENLAEDFVLGTDKDGPKLLNEDA